MGCSGAPIGAPPRPSLRFRGVDLPCQVRTRTLGSIARSDMSRVSHHEMRGVRTILALRERAVCRYRIEISVSTATTEELP
jgi:hypothetical protein